MSVDYSGVKPTKYAGILFRSRLEARWAVFFDALGIAWEYEPETFVYGHENCYEYTPDFRLTRGRLSIGRPSVYVEVKPNDEAMRSIDYKLGEAVEGSGPLRDAGLILLGPIPNGNRGTYAHAMLTWHKGPDLRWVEFVEDCNCVHLLESRDGVGGYPLPPGTTVTARPGEFGGRRARAAYDAARNERFDLHPIAAAKSEPIDPVSGRAVLGARARAGGVLWTRPA